KNDSRIRILEVERILFESTKPLNVNSIISQIQEKHGIKVSYETVVSDLLAIKSLYPVQKNEHGYFIDYREVEKNADY
ncbi:MAG: hypothetical protein KBT46_00920, partial [Ruminococcus sp.]|nr:hypothetical protein [Candidatus Copronaster equi]